MNKSLEMNLVKQQVPAVNTFLHFSRYELDKRVAKSANTFRLVHASGYAIIFWYSIFSQKTIFQLTAAKCFMAWRKNETGGVEREKSEIP